MPTLDVEEKQVLINYDDDPNFTWHHRILLCHLEGSKWIIATPTKSLQVLDLSAHRLVILARNAPFPAAQAGDAFVADPGGFTVAEVARLRTEARAMVEILAPNAGAAGSASAGANDAIVWRISDTSHQEFGEEVPSAALAQEQTFVQRGDYGLVSIDGVWTSAAKETVGATGKASFLCRFRSGPGRDPRLLGHFEDDAGRRFLSLVACISLLAEATWTRFPLDGPRVVREFFVALRSSGFSGLSDYHQDWVRNSGIAEKSAICREHKFLLELLRHMFEIDQLDVSSLASAELAVRRIFQIELATKRNPKQPDFAGLDIILETNIDSSGGVVLPGMQKWFTEHQAKEAGALKELRLWNEETRNLDKKKPA
jgi:hypothetical protein